MLVRRGIRVQADHGHTAPGQLVRQRGAVRAETDDRYIVSVHHTGRLASGRHDGQ
jgi:hypothetical protein